MRANFFKQAIPLRTAAILLVVCSFSFFLVAFQVRKMNDAVWKLLGMTKEAGNEGINMSFMQGYLYYYSAKGVKNIALGNRPAVAKDLLDYTKQYVTSEAFKNYYSKARDKAKPAEPQLLPVRTKEEIQKEQVAETEKSIKELETNMKTMSADIKKTLDPVLVNMKKQLQEYKDPNNKLYDALLQGEKYQNEALTRDHEAQLKKWESNYPEDMKILLKKRLVKLLDLTKDVDFNAELVEKFGKKQFVNPVYEKKPPEWKQAFRAGKEVSEMTRAFAAAWLKELG